jgi:hypothetical protein
MKRSAEAMKKVDPEVEKLESLKYLKLVAILFLGLQIRLVEAFPELENQRVRLKIEELKMDFEEGIVGNLSQELIIKFLKNQLNAQNQ